MHPARHDEKLTNPQSPPLTEETPADSLSLTCIRDAADQLRYPWIDPRPDDRDACTILRARLAAANDPCFFSGRFFRWLRNVTRRSIVCVALRVGHLA